MNENMTNQSYSQAGAYGQSLGSYTAKTFGWMFAGLLVTFIVAVSVVNSGLWKPLLQTPGMIYILGIAEIVTVIALSARIQKMSVGCARGMFFLYAALNGVVFSVYFLIFALDSLLTIFLLTALFFGVMALIGYFGRVDFSNLRPFMLGGLIFLMGFWILGMFIDLSGFELAACTVGIFLFLLFTAYDTKKIKMYYQYYGHSPEMAAKASVFSALALYLDFINLFLYILRVLGNRRS